MFQSIVLFIGDCEFKTPMPGNVINRGFSTYVKGFRNIVLASDQARTIDDSLQHLKGASRLSKAEHMESLRTRHASESRCPRCGERLVERTARSGRFAGKVFLGCGKFPQCKFMKNK